MSVLFANNLRNNILVGLNDTNTLDCFSIQLNIMRTANNTGFSDDWNASAVIIGDRLALLAFLKPSPNLIIGNEYTDTVL